MSNLFKYLGFIFDRYSFHECYRLLQEDPDDRELLAVTFDYGRQAVWALDDLKKEDKELSDKVHEIAKQVREKKIGREDAPYLFPPYDPPEFWIYFYGFIVETFLRVYFLAQTK